MAKAICLFALNFKFHRLLVCSLFRSWPSFSSEHHLADFWGSLVIFNPLSFKRRIVQFSFNYQWLKASCILRAFESVMSFSQLYVLYTELCSGEDWNQIFSLVLSWNTFKISTCFKWTVMWRKVSMGWAPTYLENYSHIFRELLFIWAYHRAFTIFILLGRCLLSLHLLFFSSKF